MGNVTKKINPGAMKTQLELLLNYFHSVVRSDEARLRRAMEEYARALVIEQRKAA